MNTTCFVLPEPIKIEIPEELEMNCLTNTQSFVLNKELLDKLNLEKERWKKEKLNGLIH